MIARHSFNQKMKVKDVGRELMRKDDDERKSDETVSL
jgi:hypothetical protein